jgi:hypothetical protein
MKTWIGSYPAVLTYLYTIARSPVPLLATITALTVILV